MTIRAYAESDCVMLSSLFYETVHAVNAKDYTPAQCTAWAPNAACLLPRAADLQTQKTLVAETAGRIIGFGSIDNRGYLDLLFVHKNFQRQGVATALCDALEKRFPTVTTHASVTAKPFFERRGYRVVKEEEVERNGVVLRRYEMTLQKTL